MSISGKTRSSSLSGRARTFEGDLGCASGSGRGDVGVRQDHRWTSDRGRIDVPFYELDLLAFGPEWSTAPGFVESVEQIVAGPAWIVDSWGYEPVRDAMWAAADTIVWLDYPARVVVPQLLRRSLARTVTRAEIFNGNRETWTGWLSKNHPVWHAVTSFAARREYLGGPNPGRDVTAPPYVPIHWAARVRPVVWNLKPERHRQVTSARQGTEAGKRGELTRVACASVPELRQTSGRAKPAAAGLVVAVDWSRR